jgi:hypothetical protein
MPRIFAPKRAGLTQVSATVDLGLVARTMRRYLHTARRQVQRVIEYAVRYIVEHKPQAQARAAALEHALDLWLSAD